VAKQVYQSEEAVVPTYETAPTYEATYQHPSIDLLIEGAVFVTNDFNGVKVKVTGYQQRNIDWQAVANAMSFPDGPFPDELADKIGDLLFDYDLVQFLKSRVRVIR
jgi:hypothetical protein